jgi:hypothetical protein
VTFSGDRSPGVICQSALRAFKPRVGRRST